MFLISLTYHAAEAGLALKLGAWDAEAHSRCCHSSPGQSIPTPEWGAELTSPAALSTQAPHANVWYHQDCRHFDPISKSTVSNQSCPGEGVVGALPVL